MYQQINIPDYSLVGVPGTLPANLLGLSDVSLADISAGNPNPPEGLAHQGWWPVVAVPPASFDSMSQIVVDAPLVADPTTSTVRNVQTVRGMTAEEFAVANPVPQSVTNYQARTALRGAGLRSKVDAALRGADQAVAANADAFDAWEYANNFYRDQAFVVALGPTFGLSPADIDNLFRAAAKID